MFGTRTEFASELFPKLEQYAPHKQNDRLQRNNLWLSMEQMMVAKNNPAVAMVIADYAAQFEVKRWTTPTCGIRNSHKSVMMVSCKPEAETRHIRKWGKRDASVEDVTRNYCAVVNGIFSTRHKPSAYDYNMQLKAFFTS